MCLYNNAIAVDRVGSVGQLKYLAAGMCKICSLLRWTGLPVVNMRGSTVLLEGDVARIMQCVR